MHSVPTPSREVASATTTAAAPATIDTGACANDDAAVQSPATTGNPLWIIVIGMAIFFAVAAAAMAQGTQSAQSASPAPAPVAASSEAAAPNATTPQSAAQDALPC